MWKEEFKLYKLKDVTKLKNGYAFKSNQFTENEVPIIRINNLQNNKVIIDKKICYPNEFLENNKQYEVKMNDILISMSGSIGKISRYLYTEPSLLNQRVGKFEITEVNKLDREYLFYFLRSDEFQRAVIKDANGCVVSNISAKNISDCSIPVPSLEAQKKIVKVLKKAEDAVEKRKQVINLLDELVKSKFIEMFGDLNSNSKGWNILNFNEFAVIDTNMIKDFEKYADYPHIGIDSIEKNTGNILEYQLVKDSSLKSGKYLFDERHIIYSKIRPNLNKVALPQFKGVCSADAYPILCLDGIVDRSYLGYVLRSEFFLSYILAFSGRTNIPKVNKEQLRGFNMPTPPIELQNQFADFVKQVDKLKFEMEKSLKELENNFNSLIQKAFNGKLLD